MPFDSKSGKEHGKGRPKGSKNRNTNELRQRVSMLIDDLHEDLIEDIKKLTPNEKMRALTALLEYSLPKLQRSEGTLSIDIEKLNDEAIDILFDRLSKNTNNG